MQINWHKQWSIGRHEWVLTSVSDRHRPFFTTVDWEITPNKGLLWHTDRGSQYASYNHRELLKEHGIIQSMSRKGNCYDNAVAESFFHTLKTGMINHRYYQTREEAEQDIFEYIEVFYNRIRLHSTNGYWSLVDYEEMQKAV